MANRKPRYVVEFNGTTHDVIDDKTNTLLMQWDPSDKARAEAQCHRLNADEAERLAKLRATKTVRHTVGAA